jgi:hypothetical protein
MIIKIYKIFPQVKVESLNQQNYYKFAAYATKNLTDDVAHIEGRIGETWNQNYRKLLK